MKKIIFLGAVLIANTVSAQFTTQDSSFIAKIYNKALTEGQCYENLRDLCKNVGARLSGSPQAQKAVEWGINKVKSAGLVVSTQDIMVPNWKRGSIEKVELQFDKDPKIYFPLDAKSLGGSIGKGATKPIIAEVIELKSLDELAKLGKEKIKGKIVFFNRPMDPSHLHVFNAYGGAVDQRSKGPMDATAYGAVAVVVRSMTLSNDEYPHTGSARINAGDTICPALAISTKSADELSAKLKLGPQKLRIFSDSNWEQEVPSKNVLGTLKADNLNLISVGGHLDSWDVGEGAHDDGAGIVQSLEAIRILKDLGYKPKNNLRCVFWMNEENGLRGGKAYREQTLAEKNVHIAAIESDGGGFTPRGFSIGTKDEIALKRIMSFKTLLEPYGLHSWHKGWGGADTSPLEADGVTCLELSPDSQRYFDLHHTDKDVFESVNKRELELGAAALAATIYLIDQYGLK